MCLTIRNKYKGVLVAKKDITVYKLVRVIPTHAGFRFTAPYRHINYNIRKGVSTRTFGFRTYDDDVVRFIKHIPYGVYSVDDGIHAYTSKRAALNRLYTGRMIVKCIIPKGTRYILGHDSEIVSLKLRFVKALPSLKSGEVGENARLQKIRREVAAYFNSRLAA